MTTSAMSSLVSAFLILVTVPVVSFSSSIAHSATEQRLLNHVEMNGSVESKFVAFVETNSRSKKIKVSIVNDICGQFSSGGGTRCMAAAALVRSFELSYKKSKDTCNTTIYTATRDLRTADGELVEIVFEDNTARTCENTILGKHVLTVNVDSLRGNPVRFLAHEKSQSTRDDGAIYEALNVEEEVLNPGILGSSRTRKSVGGLVCEKASVIVPDAVPSYSCQLLN